MAAINNICFSQIDKTGYCQFYQRIAFISLMIESNNFLKIESDLIYYTGNMFYYYGLQSVI